LTCQFRRDGGFFLKENSKTGGQVGVNRLSQLLYELSFYFVRPKLCQITGGLFLRPASASLVGCHLHGLGRVSNFDFTEMEFSLLTQKGRATGKLPFEKVFRSLLIFPAG
jgi:hypothetical protein